MVVGAVVAAGGALLAFLLFGLRRRREFEGPRARASESADVLEPAPVEVKATLLPDQESFVRQILTAYLEAGASPTEAPLLVAHSALATGWGRRHIYNYNIGVLKAGANYRRSGGAWVWLFGPEHIDGRNVRVRSRWRAYSSFRESAADLLGLLLAPRYADARRMLSEGNAFWYGVLGRAGFYNQPPDEHQRSYFRVLARVRRLLA